jgi:hypothetical protein
MLPYISIGNKKGENVLELTLGNKKKKYPATIEGAKQMAAALVKANTSHAIHSSSLDHLDEYDINFDVMGVIHEEFNRLTPVTPVGYWVFMTNRAMGLVRFGEDGGREFPYENKENAVKHAEYLLTEYEGECRVYLLSVFATGEIRQVEQEL